MKVSNVLSYATFILVIAFSMTIFAADAPSIKQVQRKTPTTVAPTKDALNKNTKLPSVIKINPADVNMLATSMVDDNMEKAKAAGQKIKLDSEKIAQMLPLTEQQISIYRNKVNECKNKNYTVEDQKKAECTDGMTIAECSKLLFYKCVENELKLAVYYTNGIYNHSIETENDVKELHKSISYVNNHFHQYAK